MDLHFTMVPSTAGSVLRGALFHSVIHSKFTNQHPLAWIGPSEWI